MQQRQQEGAAHASGRQPDLAPTLARTLRVDDRALVLDAEVGAVAVMHRVRKAHHAAAGGRLEGKSEAFARWYVHRPPAVLDDRGALS